jgi:trimethylamine--corrinoid protein Co-methyltransferase
MDDEIIGMSRLICGGVEVNEETLAVDEICNVGPGGHYLYEDHTMKWFRKHWQPTLMDRNSYEDWDAQGRTTMKDRIVKKTRDIIANHEGPISRVPGEAKKDIQKILDEAEERVRSK